MEPNARYTLVGAIVLLTMVAIAVAVVWLSKSGSLSGSKHYVIYFREYSSAGLQRDGLVTMRGIKVGTVKSLAISKDDIEDVRVEIQVDPGIPVKTDTQAVVQRNLLTGLANIELVGGTRAAPRLRSVPEGENLPVIPEGKNQLAELQSSLPRLATRAEQLLDRANLFFSDQNRESVTTILSSTAKLSEQLAEHDQDIVDTVHALAEGARALDNLILNVKDGVTSAVLSVAALGESVNREVRDVSRSVSGAASRVSRSAEAFEDPRSAFFGPPDTALGPGE